MAREQLTNQDKKKIKKIKKFNKAKKKALGLDGPLNLIRLARRQDGSRKVGQVAKPTGRWQCLF